MGWKKYLWLEEGGGKTLQGPARRGVREDQTQAMGVVIPMTAGHGAPGDHAGQRLLARMGTARVAHPLGDNSTISEPGGTIARTAELI